jgi:hypothetical protein
VDVVAVVGAGQASAVQEDAAFAVGRLLASRGVTLVTGGLGGVMAAASRGARSADGVVVGILPGLDRAEANAWVTVAVPTGLGELRNGLVVRACDGVIAVGGGYGTLSEVALALKAGKPVIGLAFGFDVDGVVAAGSPEEAVAQLVR